MWKKKVTKFYRGLNPADTRITSKVLRGYAETIRMESKSLDNDKRNAVLGQLAEETALYQLKVIQRAVKGVIMESFIFEFAPGKTTEIDLILITKKALYFLECKHRSRDVKVNGDGSFTVDGRTESPINQNIGHIRKLLQRTSYGNMANGNIYNIIYLMLPSKNKLNTSNTIFKKEGIYGAFANENNLIPLIANIERGIKKGKIPVNQLYKDLQQIGKGLQGEKGMKQHVKYVKSIRRN